MTNSYSNKEDRIFDAINTWDTGEFRSIRAAAIDFDVDVRTLQRRLAGGGSRIGRTPPNKALSDEQEMAICDYIRMLDQAEQSARFPMVRGAANYLLREVHLDAFTPPPIVSNSWTKRFLNRNPQFFKRKQNLWWPSENTRTMQRTYVNISRHIGLRARRGE